MNASLAAARIGDGVCPACGAEVASVEHNEGFTRYEFTSSAVPRVVTCRPEWRIAHVDDDSPCVVSAGVARAVVAVALHRMRESA